VSHGYSNERHFDPRVSTHARRIEKHTSYAGYPDGQANYPTFQRKIHTDVMVTQQCTRVL
jgi:hypothetical protein